MSAICSACKQEMVEGGECTFNKVRYADGKVMERSTQHFEEPSGLCHDCNILHGKYHHPGCDAERCPRCGGQFIGCDCDIEYVERSEI